MPSLIMKTLYSAVAALILRIKMNCPNVLTRNWNFRNLIIKLIVISVLAILLYHSVFSQSLSDNSSFQSPSDNSTLIVFAYAQGEHRDLNLQFFVNNGGIVDEPTYRYVLIASGVSWANLSITKDILKFQNVELMERENTGYDACAWKQALDKHGNLSSRFILLNGSGRGPFLPNYAEMNWPEYILKPFEKSNVGLSGSTFNCDRTHIQSNLLAFTRKTYDILYNTLGCYNSKQELIDKGEIAYSNNVLNAGYNLFVMALYFKGHNFLDVEQTTKKCKDIPTDTYYPNLYFGIDNHPLELIFIKTNRGISPKVIENYSRWASEFQAIHKTQGSVPND